MAENSEIIRKADMTIADLASGGKLNDEQTDTFIRKLILQPTVLRDSRVIQMSSPQRQINKIGFGSRILRPAVSGTGLAVGDRSKPTTEQVLLSTKEVIAEVRLPYDVIEDNIESGNINAAGAGSSHQPVQGDFKDTIVELMAQRAATDLEELAIQGDTGSGDTYLALSDGYLVQATSNIVDGTGVGVGKELFKAGLQGLPDQYKRELGSLRHYLSMNNEIEYRDALASRETGLGDGVVQGLNPVFGFGVPVTGVGLMPGTSGLLTHPMNCIFGIQRDISIEVDKDISARVFIIVLTARVDFKLEEEEAVVKYTNIGA